MAPIDTAVVATHLLFAGLWTGSVVFVAGAVVPTATRGDLNAGPLSTIGDRLATVSRLSALALFVTGGHMAARGYTFETLAGSLRGHLVLAMFAMWFVLAGLVEVGTARLGGADEGLVREPARDARRVLQAAAVVAGLLLVDAGLLAAG